MVADAANWVRTDSADALSSEWRAPTQEQIHFWLRELRTPALLIEGAHAFAEAAQQHAADRPALRAALANDEAAVLKSLADEEAHERELDHAYWAPLRAELERLRRR